MSQVEDYRNKTKHTSTGPMCWLNEHSFLEPYKLGDNIIIMWSQRQERGRAQVPWRMIRSLASFPGPAQILSIFLHCWDIKSGNNLGRRLIWHAVSPKSWNADEWNRNNTARSYELCIFDQKWKKCLVTCQQGMRKQSSPAIVVCIRGYSAANTRQVMVVLKLELESAITRVQ